jgi:hypothetical protein
LIATLAGIVRPARPVAEGQAPAAAEARGPVEGGRGEGASARVAGRQEGSPRRGGGAIRCRRRGGARASSSTRRRRRPRAVARSSHPSAVADAACGAPPPPRGKG